MSENFAYYVRKKKKVVEGILEQDAEANNWTKVYTENASVRFTRLEKIRIISCFEDFGIHEISLELLRMVVCKASKKLVT
jgi:hypothetical protein